MGTHPIFESDFDCLTDMEDVELFFFDYNIVGKRLGTHSSITIHGHEYWYSMKGLKKRNLKTRSKFVLDEASLKWVQCDLQVNQHSIIEGITHTIKNLGSVGTNSQYPREKFKCGRTEISAENWEFYLKHFILSDFTAKAYSIPDHNCNDFTSMALKFLKPTESHVGLNALAKVMLETAQTVNDIEHKIEDTKNQAIDFVEHNLPLVVAGAAAAGTFILAKIFR